MLPSICHRLRFLYVVVVSLVNAFVPVTLWKVRRYTSHLRSTRPSSASSSSLPGTSSIEYVVGSIDFASLQQIGLNISSDLANRNSIPLHITTPADIFCNRELNMQLIQVIGFDMDWTLALYNEEFDMLAFEGAKEKLVHWLGYPKDVLDLKYELNMCRRGCIIDKTSGNILKLDQHRYVREVEHGITPLDAEQRKTVYRASYQEFETFNGKNFVNIDTPFSLVDGSLFMLLVDLKDKLAAALNSRDQADDSKDLISARSQLIGKSYSQVWNDMRKCIDRCHKDGVIKDIVAQNPSKYITYDRHLFPMLEEFRRLGRKVFLLTNSLWEYTQVVMNYLEGGSAKSTPPSRDLKWQDYFDLIIVGGNKPAFLLDERSLPLFKVDPVSGRLINLECLPGNSEEAVDFLNKNGKLFQGGNAQILHKLLNVTSGDSLIYVGDHMYSDILRSKRTLGWRTCLIVPELQGEIKMYKKQRKARMELLQLRKTQFMVEEIMDSMKAEVIDYKLKKDKLYRLHRERNTLISDSSLPSLTNSKDIDFGIQDLTNELQRLDEKLRREISVLKRSVSLRLRETAASAADNTGGVPRDAQTAVDVGTEREDLQVTADQGMRKNAAALAELEEDLMALGRLIRTKLNSYDKSFHSRWGQLFKAGFQESRFAKQVKDYSCVYTGKVSNLGMASPTRPFRPVRDKMPHDHFLEGF